MSDRTAYAWDSSVFLAYLKKEADKPLDDIAAVAREIEADQADLIVSITTKIELLDAVDDQQIADALNKFLLRKNVILSDVNPAVAEAALQVRHKGNKCTPKRNVKMADAQIIGTAIAYGADVLHTLDDKILNLSKTGIVNGLLVTKPKLMSGQMTLRFSQSAAAGTMLSRHFQKDGRCFHFGPALSAFELACVPRTLSASHR